MSRETDNPKTDRPTASVGRPNTKPTIPPGGGGFTLVELLVVVAIISLLLLIGAPSALVIQRNVARGISQTTLETIAAGLKAYRDDLGDFPPSNPRGAEAICRLLTGYPPDQGNDQTPGAAGGAFERDDGYEGFGFRLSARGPRHGPYFGADKLNMAGGGEKNTTFIDSFRHTVLYYRYDPNAQAGLNYRSSDNTEGPSNINGYAIADSGQYYRKDFLLITLGPDGEWTDPIDGGDDITNFR